MVGAQNKGIPACWLWTACEPRLGRSSLLRLQQEAMRKFRDEDVGGRLVYSLTGSSPIAPEVLVFLRDALQAPTYEGYGSTEAGYVRPAL